MAAILDSSCLRSLPNQSSYWLFQGLRDISFIRSISSQVTLALTTLPTCVDAALAPPPQPLVSFWILLPNHWSASGFPCPTIGQLLNPSPQPPMSCFSISFSSWSSECTIPSDTCSPFQPSASWDGGSMMDMVHSLPTQALAPAPLYEFSMLSSLPYKTGQLYSRWWSISASCLCFSDGSCWPWEPCPSCTYCLLLFKAFPLLLQPNSTHGIPPPWFLPWPF